MKPSKMKKDKNITLRINGQIKEVLKKLNMSPQKLFDEMLDKKVKVKLNASKGE